MRRAMPRSGSSQADARAARQIERADIERRAHGNLGAAVDQLFGKQRAGIAVIERAVDMRRGDRDEALARRAAARLSATMRIAIAAPSPRAPLAIACCSAESASAIAQALRALYLMVSKREVSAS